MDWLGEFFRALPAVLRALWQFGDGFYGVAVMLGSLALLAAFTFVALRLREVRGWLSSVFGVMAITIGMWWGFGVLPSAWVYFVDGERDLLEGTVIPAALPGMDNFYEVFRDVIVLGMTGVALVAFGVIALAVQKRYPRALAGGEESGPKSGGYK